MSTLTAPAQTRAEARPAPPSLWRGRLLLIAGIVLLFTARYPKPLYDLVLGMDRWALRVAAYAGLMTDAYPPFRLDQGGIDPGSQPAWPTPPAPTGLPTAGPMTGPPAPVPAGR